MEYNHLQTDNDTHTPHGKSISFNWVLRNENWGISTWKSFSQNTAYVRRRLNWMCALWLRFYLQTFNYTFTLCERFRIPIYWSKTYFNNVGHKFTTNFLNENHSTALQRNCINLFITSVHAVSQQALSDFTTISLDSYSFERYRNFIQLNSFMKFR